MKLTTLAAALFALSPFALSPTAMAQPPQGMPDIGAMFLKQFDANHDGKVTREEFIKPSEAQFDLMDSNGDGAVDEGELEAWQAGMMQRIRQGGGAPR